VISDADGGLLAVWSLDITEDHIQSIRSVVNPDKLAHLGRVSGLRTALERARQRRG
jgi:RNA polymerase sigma-70 factor (ECF subfamily)